MNIKIELNELQKERIKDWTFRCYPNEMCGFLTKEDFIPCQNIAEDPENSFKIAPEVTAKWLSQAIAVVHSHTKAVSKVTLFDLRTPSHADYKGQKLTGVPWLIVGCEGVTVSDPVQIPRVPSREYVGRSFQWFLNDCYNLVQDWYLFELGIELPDAIIPENYTSVRTINGIFDEHIENFGFREVSYSELQDNDLVLIDFGGSEGNHLGVFSQGWVYHQDLVSVKVPYSNFIGRIRKVLRYSR